MASLSINAVGDISLGDHPVCVGHGMRSVFNRIGSEVYDDIKSELMGADLNICNVETVISNVGFRKYWLPSFEMRGDPSHLTYLKDAGFNVLGVANNHAMQHGLVAFEDMVNNISNHDFSIIGFDTSDNVTKIHKTTHKDGLVSGVFAISIRPEEWTTKGPIPYSLRDNIDKVVEEVRKYREECTGFLICSIHWGLEFLEYPAPSQVNFGRALIDAGVDVIFGHHPHVLQPVEKYKNGLIFYSLGNFVFDLWTDPTKLSAIVKVNLETGSRPCYEIVPIKIGDDMKLSKANGDDLRNIHNNLSWEIYENRNDIPCSDYEYEDRYKQAALQFRYSSYKYFLKNIRKYPIVFLMHSLARTVLRRIAGV